MSYTDWDSLNDKSKPNVLCESNKFTPVESYVKLCKYIETKYVCFLDIESNSKFIKYKTCEFLPKIKEMSVVLFKRENSNCASQCFQCILDHVNAQKPAPPCVEYSAKVKSLKQEKYKKLLDFIFDQWPSVTLVAHNGFSFDFKILAQMLPDTAVCSDSLLTIKVSLCPDRQSSYKNTELFKQSQSDWSNYFLLSNAHDSIYDVVMSVIWCDHFKLDHCRYSCRLRDLKEHWRRECAQRRGPKNVSRKINHSGCIVSKPSFLTKKVNL